jgi:hypothetical protein
MSGQANPIVTVVKSSLHAKGVLGRQAGAEILDNFFKGGKDVAFELILI